MGKLLEMKVEVLGCGYTENSSIYQLPRKTVGWVPSKLDSHPGLCPGGLLLQVHGLKQAAKTIHLDALIKQQFKFFPVVLVPAYVLVIGASLINATDTTFSTN
ncbi:hypothetical protein ACLOJK_033553 [Asimina triloba]